MSWDQAPVCFGADPVLHYENKNAPTEFRSLKDCSRRRSDQLLEEGWNLIVGGPRKSDFCPITQTKLSTICKEVNAFADKGLVNHYIWNRS
jgi:hypothetical protein